MVYFSFSLYRGIYYLCSQEYNKLLRVYILFSQWERWLLGFFHLILLATIQGLTEFIPVSSSAHLSILPLFFYIEKQSIGIDIAVHLGSLMAVCHIFHKDLSALFKGLIEVLFKKDKSKDSRIFLLVLIATAPIVLMTIVFVLFDLINHLRSIYVIAIASIVFSIPLLLADKICTKKRFIEEFSLSDAIYIGFWQSFAIIPGASRSGCCITGALIRGFRNFDAAHLSLIMSIPTILGSSVLLVLEIFTPSSTDFFAQNLIDVIYCVVFSYFAAFVSIKVFFRFIQKISFLPFVIYRILFGSFIIIFLGLI